MPTQDVKPPYWLQISEAVQALAHTLLERYPAAFCAEPAAVRPLKISIDRDIQQALEAFVQGAETPDVSPPPPDMVSPWEVGRPDVIKTYILRLPEPYHLKLHYIAEHTPYSMQRFLQDVIYAAIDQQIAALSKPS